MIVLHDQFSQCPLNQFNESNFQEHLAIWVCRFWREVTENQKWNDLMVFQDTEMLLHVTANYSLKTG